MTNEQINALPRINIKGDAETRDVYINDEYLSPVNSQAIYNHSPDGFNWGYGGSGPAQLALAVLMEFLPVKEAMQFRQQFKFDVIAALPLGKDFNIDIDLKEKILKYSEL